MAAGGLFIISHHRPVTSAGRTPDNREEGHGFKPRPDQLRKKCFLCNDIWKWSDFLVFLDKDDKP